MLEDYCKANSIIQISLLWCNILALFHYLFFCTLIGHYLPHKARFHNHLILLLLPQLTVLQLSFASSTEEVYESLGVRKKHTSLNLKSEQL